MRSILTTYILPLSLFPFHSKEFSLVFFLPQTLLKAELTFDFLYFDLIE